MTVPGSSSARGPGPPPVAPPCDPGFRPVVFAYRDMLDRAARFGELPVKIGVEREDGLVSVFESRIPDPVKDPRREETRQVVERIVKFLLWSRGGWRIHFLGPAGIGERLRADYAAGGSRDFDVRLMGRIYERPFEVAVHRDETFPEARESRRHLGGFLDGCRIGFDLGASDYKVAAVKDGEPVFSEEIPWTPAVEADPDYHYRRIRDGLKRAAAHLPRVDAIGGSSAGVFINNQVRIASLFRAVPEDVFEDKVKGLFLRFRDEWGVPFEVLNDGEVTALAGMLSLGEKAVLGMAMGSSQAAGFLNEDGHLMDWLDELAFVPVDLSPGGAVDEWSGDRGVGAGYFSQQAANRLAIASGFVFSPDQPLPERLKVVQARMEAGDERAARIYESIGVYLGSTIPWYEVFYPFRNLLVLGRVMSGPGGDVIVRKADEVLRAEFPATASRVRIHLLDEKSRRVGQAVAAASLPEIGPAEVDKGARS
jgi:predicted NBD/HSP70 family sugar kinase